MRHYDDAATWVADNIDKVTSEETYTMYSRTVKYYCDGALIASRGGLTGEKPGVIRLTEGASLNTKRGDELVELLEVWENHQQAKEEEARKKKVAEEFYQTMNPGCKKPDVDLTDEVVDEPKEKEKPNGIQRFFSLAPR